MTYKEVIDYLYARLPMFTRDGVSAFKKDLTNTLRLCEAVGNPHRRIKAIHVAGTNGKGSTSHMLAAILQQAGYKTGLYTSPHLVDFRERIRLNGAMIPQEAVIRFVQSNVSLIEDVQPSFFEVTAVMAFDYFAREQVDVAIIETGLGGRLDSTNVINPVLSVITNIGYDHMNMLGSSLAAIGAEKAGIIKPRVPVVIGERQPELEALFLDKAKQTQSKLIFATDEWQVSGGDADHHYLNVNVTKRQGREPLMLTLDLRGDYQKKNVVGVLAAINELNALGFVVTHDETVTALKQVRQLTGLMGRWQTLSEAPLVICDTGHNENGWRAILANIAAIHYDHLHIVLGVMQDKDLDKMLPLLPKNARYYFCQVDMPRAMETPVLQSKASGFGLLGNRYKSVMQAVTAARENAESTDLIFVGGSTFVVGELLAEWQG